MCKKNYKKKFAVECSNPNELRLKDTPNVVKKSRHSCPEFVKNALLVKRHPFCRRCIRGFEGPFNAELCHIEGASIKCIGGKERACKNRIPASTFLARLPNIFRNNAALHGTGSSDDLQ